jgi:hypothetical protein
MKSLRAKPGDLDEVTQLYAETHEGWPVKPPEWSRYVNVLVVKDKDPSRPRSSRSLRADSDPGRADRHPRAGRLPARHRRGTES